MSCTSRKKAVVPPWLCDSGCACFHDCHVPGYLRGDVLGDPWAPPCRRLRVMALTDAAGPLSAQELKEWRHAIPLNKSSVNYSPRAAR